MGFPLLLYVERRNTSHVAFPTYIHKHIHTHIYIKIYIYKYKIWLVFLEPAWLFSWPFFTETQKLWRADSCFTCKKRDAHPRAASQVSFAGMAKKAALAKRQQCRTGTDLAWGTSCPNPLARPRQGPKEAMANMAVLGGSHKRLEEQGEGFNAANGHKAFHWLPRPQLRLPAGIRSFFCKHYQQHNGHIPAKCQGTCWDEGKAMPCKTLELPQEQR